MGASGFGKRRAVLPRPLDEAPQRVDERTSERRELVVDARRRGRKDRPFDEAVLFQRLQRQREHAVEQLRLVLVELQMAPLRSAVHVQRSEFVDMLTHGKTSADVPRLEQAADAMLDDLLWWTRTLKAGRLG